RQTALDRERGRIEPREASEQVGATEEERRDRLERPHRCRTHAAVDERQLPVAAPRQPGEDADRTGADHEQAVRLLALAEEGLVRRERPPLEDLSELSQLRVGYPGEERDGVEVRAQDRRCRR